jgi:signal transduction histidine kinase
VHTLAWFCGFFVFQTVIRPTGNYLQEFNMKRSITVSSLVCILVATFSMGAQAQSKATAAEATAMVKKGIAFAKANGKDKAYAEISNKAGQFIDRDLYLTVYGLDGTVRAHGANEKMIGKNLMDLKDIDGTPFVKERMELAKTKGTFWQDYKFTNPTTKKIEPKSMYCEKLDDSVLCGGIYK